MGGGRPAAAGGKMTTFPTGAEFLTGLFMEFHNVHPPFFSQRSPSPEPRAESPQEMFPRR